jgi:hypothetical protein
MAVPVKHDPFAAKYVPERHPPVHEAEVLEQAVTAPPPTGMVYPGAAYVQLVDEA